jgi:hypothetical protein
MDLRVWNVETGVCERVLRDHEKVSEVFFLSPSLRCMPLSH